MAQDDPPKARSTRTRGKCSVARTGKQGRLATAHGDAKPPKFVDHSPEMIRRLIDVCFDLFDDCTLGLLDAQGVVMAKLGAPELGRWFSELVEREHARRSGIERGPQPVLRCSNEMDLRKVTFVLGVMYASLTRQSSGPLPDQSVVDRFMWYARELLCGAPTFPVSVTH